MFLNKIQFILKFALWLKKLLFAFFWTLVLSWLCHKGYKTISWFIVLLPFIMMFLVSFGIMRHMREVDKLNPMVN